MTVKGRYGQYRRVVLALTLTLFGSSFGSCANAGTRPGSSVIELKSASKVNAQAELSNTDIMPGTVVFVTLRLGKDLVPNLEKEGLLQGQFEGISLPFFPIESLGRGVYGTLLGVPYDRKPGPGTINVSVQGGADAGLQVPLNIIEGVYPSESLHVDKKRVNPTNPKVLARIRREQLEVGEIYKKISPVKYWSEAFALPIQSEVTSPFGSKRVYNGKLKNFHTGLDLKAAMRTPIYSTAGGVVAMAKSLFYTGNTVILDHGFGIITLYAHMTSLKVVKGQKVKAHELLGLSGKTGRVNGPHLHWQAVVHGVKVNPLGLIKVMR